MAAISSTSLSNGVIHRVGIGVGSHRNGRIQLPPEPADRIGFDNPAAAPTRMRGWRRVRELRGTRGAVPSRLVALDYLPSQDHCEGGADECDRAETECVPPLSVQTLTLSRSPTHQQV
jgi:hypothetical protein